VALSIPAGRVSLSDPPKSDSCAIPMGFSQPAQVNNESAFLAARWQAQPRTVRGVPNYPAGGLVVE